MMEKKTTIELLPNGQFIITEKSGQQHKGRFSMYVLDRFCNEKKVDNFLMLFEKLLIGMSIGDYADLVLMALQDYVRNNHSLCPFNRADILDLLDDMGGLASDEMRGLFKHACERVGKVKEAEASPAARNDGIVDPLDELKKKEQSSSLTE